LEISEVKWNEVGEMKTPSKILFLYSGIPHAEDKQKMVFS
jgi:hypothetical protein